MHSECSLRRVAQLEGDLDLEVVPVGRQQYVTYTYISLRGEIKCGPTVDSLRVSRGKDERGNLPQSACTTFFYRLSYPYLSFERHTYTHPRFSGL